MPPTIDWSAVDGAFRARLEAAPESRRWLLIQSIATAAPRRTLLSTLGIGAGSRVLDAGCGFGVSAMELACLAPLNAVGVDSDTSVLSVASGVADDLASSGSLAPGSTARFVAGDVYDLPLPDAHVDAAISRFVFQHLSDTKAAAAELARVVRPGGLACVIDVDDGLSISEPPPSEAFSLLGEALRSTQASGGGDRRIGRKLAGVFDQAGFEPSAVVVMPQAAYRRSAAGDPARLLLVERFRAAREAIVAAGALSAADFDSCLASLATEETGPVCEIEAQVAVVARRRY